MKENIFLKSYYYAYSIIAYLYLFIKRRFKKHNSHQYFVNFSTLMKFYNEYGILNIIRALIRVPENLNLSKSGIVLFRNSYFPKNKKTALTTSIEITENCPYQCNGCYIDKNSKKSKYFMSEELLRNTIESLSYSTLILIQGGEPLQKNSVKMIYKVLNDYPHQSFVLVTTGEYISKNGIGDFAKLNNILWSISINGTEEINDKIRFKKSYKYATKAMDIIRAEQQYFIATVTLSKENIDDATSEKFIMMLANKGVKEIRYLLLRDSSDLQLSLDTVDFYHQKVKKYNKYVFLNFWCDELVDYCVIDPYGKKRIDRTGYDHTLKYEDNTESKKHYFWFALIVDILRLFVFFNIT